jgi:hypothetical protein
MNVMGDVNVNNTNLCCQDRGSDRFNEQTPENELTLPPPKNKPKDDGRTVPEAHIFVGTNFFYFRDGWMRRSASPPVTISIVLYYELLVPLDRREDR